MTFEPVIDPLKIALLMAVAVLLALRAYCFRTTPQSLSVVLLGLRLLAALILGVVLMNPVTGLESAQRRKPVLVVLLDRSSSMAERDVNGKSRWERALELTAGNDSFLRSVSSKFDLRFSTFSRRAEASSPEQLSRTKPDGAETDLSSSLLSMAAGTSSEVGGAILLVSDGRDTADGLPVEAALAARRRGLTVSALCFGREGQTVDVQVRALRAEVSAAPGQTVRLDAEIAGRGDYGQARVELLRDSRIVQSRSVKLGLRRRQISFQVRETAPGGYRYTFRASKWPAETDLMNNETDTLVRVSETRSRVLLLDGRPSWDSKFLLRTLREDPSVVADAIYLLTPAKFYASLASARPGQAVAVPNSLDALSRYDVLIVGRGLDSFYAPKDAERLKRWVADRGGNLILLRGRPDERLSSLRDLEPVTWSEGELAEARLRLTEEGKQHPSFSQIVRDGAFSDVRSLPPLVAASRVQGEKALSVVLGRVETDENVAEDSEMALLAHMRYGKGRVLAIVGQGIWRWALASPVEKTGSSLYRDFWSQTLRWLAGASDFLPGARMSLRSDRAVYAPNETVNLLGLVRQGAILPDRVTILGPDGRKSSIATSPGDGKSADFVASFRPPAPGRYLAESKPSHVRENSAIAAFRVRAGNLESVDRGADPGLMREIARAGGGEYVAPNRLSDWARRMSAGFGSSRSREKTESVWANAWFLALLVATIGVEWILRRRAEMI